MVLNWRLRPLLRDKGNTVGWGNENSALGDSIRSSERADATFKAEREMQSGKDDRRPDDAERWRERGGKGKMQSLHCSRRADRSVDRTRTRTAAALDEAAAAREEVMDGMGMRVGGRAAAAAAVHGGAARGGVHDDRASERAAANGTK